MPRIKEPFRIIVHRSTSTLELLGDMDDRPAVGAELERLSQVPQQAWLIDAKHLRLSPEGVEMWMKAVTRFLYSATLEYLPSHLALVLDGEDTYQHPSSRFPSASVAHAAG